MVEDIQTFLIGLFDGGLSALADVYKTLGLAGFVIVVFVWLNIRAERNARKDRKAFIEQLNQQVEQCAQDAKEIRDHQNDERKEWREQSSKIIDRTTCALERLTDAIKKSD